jgi:hypothetical protein
MELATTVIALILKPTLHNECGIVLKIIPVLKEVKTSLIMI